VGDAGDVVGAHDEEQAGFVQADLLLELDRARVLLVTSHSIPLSNRNDPVPRGAAGALIHPRPGRVRPS
jgi:hypothetical protein